MNRRLSGLLIFYLLLLNVVFGCSIFRNYTVNGPISLSSLPFIKDFTKYNMSLWDIDVYTDGRNKCSENQVPEIAKKYLAKFEGCFEKTWSTELVEILVEAAQKEEDYSPLDYPFCVQDYYTALKNYPVEGQRVFTSIQ